MGVGGESRHERQESAKVPQPVAVTPQSLGFALCEALSWAVAGELMLTAPELMAPLYPDTMPLYDILWLRTESGRDLATMNRLGGSLPDGRNLWELAAEDPRKAAAVIRVQEGLPVGPGTQEQARLAFRVAHWLLEGLQVHEGEGPQRGLLCFGNLEGGIRDEERLKVPTDWLSEEPYWLHWMLKDSKPVGVLNFRQGAYRRISHPRLPETVLREDGTPGCPLAYRLRLDRPGSPTRSTMGSVPRARREARIHEQVTGWNVTLEPLFSLAAGEIFINSLPKRTSS